MTDDLFRLRVQLRDLCNGERAMTRHLAFARSAFDLGVAHMMMHREQVAALLPGEASLIPLPMPTMEKP